MTGAKRGGQPPSRRISLEIVDFSDDVAMTEFVRTVRSRGFDVLVNCAGINVVAPFEKVDLADFDRVSRVNVRAPLLLCQAVLPHMRERRWGRIVNISSVYGHVSREGRASYSTSKFGLDGMTAALAAEVARDGVLANCVAPGFVDTDLTRSVLGEQGMREMESRIPVGRLAAPAEIARLVVWLGSRENTYVSGQNILIDGGFTRV